MAAEDDFIAALGMPFLAHRLRRLSEQIVEATSASLRARGFSGPPKSVSTLLLLQEHGPLGITEIAQRLRLSHPLIIRFVRGLQAEGYVKQGRDQADARRRLISLTPKGQRQATAFREIHPVVAKALESASRDAGTDLYQTVQAFETALARRSLVDRLEAAERALAHGSNED